MVSDAFTPYEMGLEELQQELGQQHVRPLEFLNYDHQLRTNIRQAREDGETPVLSADRNRIVRQLDALALEAVKISFNELCGLGRYKPVLTASMTRLPPLVMLFFNLVVIIILAFILKSRVSTSLPCVPSIVGASSRAVILLILFHLAWRYFNPVFKVAGGAAKVTGVTLPIKVIASLADALHPYPQILSDTALWISAVVISLAAGVLGLSPLSPFCVQEVAVQPLFEIFRQVGYGEDFAFTALGGKLDARYTESDWCRHSGTFGLQLVYAMGGAGNGGWGVQWDNAPTKNFDASGFSALVLWVIGTHSGETFQIGLKDTNDREVKVESGPLVLVSRSRWQMVRVELSQFRENGVNVASLRNLNFGFNRNHGSSIICIDDIAFE